LLEYADTAEMMIAVTREKGFLPPLLMYQELVERGYTRTYGV